MQIWLWGYSSIFDVLGENIGTMKDIFWFARMVLRGLALLRCCRLAVGDALFFALPISVYMAVILQHTALESPDLLSRIYTISSGSIPS
jgi:hypothetical protein